MALVAATSCVPCGARRSDVPDLAGTGVPRSGGALGRGARTCDAADPQRHARRPLAKQDTQAATWSPSQSECETRGTGASANRERLLVPRAMLSARDQGARGFAGDALRGSSSVSRRDAPYGGFLGPRRRDAVSDKDQQRVSTDLELLAKKALKEI